MRILLPALLLASPAFAHGGLHLHPHGIDAAWALAAGTLALGGGLVAIRIRARRK